MWKTSGQVGHRCSMCASLLEQRSTDYTANQQREGIEAHRTCKGRVLTAASGRVPKGGCLHVGTRVLCGARSVYFGGDRDCGLDCGRLGVMD